MSESDKPRLSMDYSVLLSKHTFYSTSSQYIFVYHIPVLFFLMNRNGYLYDTSLPKHSITDRKDPRLWDKINPSLTLQVSVPTKRNTVSLNYSKLKKYLQCSIFNSIHFLAKASCVGMPMSLTEQLYAILQKLLHFLLNRYHRFVWGLGEYQILFWRICYSTCCCAGGYVLRHVVSWSPWHWLVLACIVWLGQKVRYFLHRHMNRIKLSVILTLCCMTHFGV